MTEFLLGWCPRKLSVSQEEFNALGDDEREAILPDRLFGDSAGTSGAIAGWPGDVIPSLPPVVLPSQEVIAESRESPVLAMFAKLAEFVGPGRRLTKNGNPSLADARELVPLLGTGDPVDERIGDKVYPTRSSVDLPVLRLLFAWAKNAGIVQERQSAGHQARFGAGRRPGEHCSTVPWTPCLNSGW